MQQKAIRHLLFWIAYLAFETYTEFLWIISQFRELNYWAGFRIAFEAETVTAIVVKLPLVYASFYFLNRYTIVVTNKWKLAASLSVILLLFSVFGHFLTVDVLVPYIYENRFQVEFLGFMGVLNSFMDKVFIVGVAIALKQYNASQKLRVREQLLVKEKLATELNFLKSQINPHFLFNTLNNIYALARKKSDETPDVVLRLSKLLRFVLYEAQNQKITISREIQFLNDYIALEKIRYGERLRIDFHPQTDNENTLIMPLILVPFVENAFKHGAGESTADVSIIIHLKLEKAQLSFVVENTFERESQTEISDGIGLGNLRRQLELTYPDFNLATQSEGATFKAMLEINLNQQP